VIVLIAHIVVPQVTPFAIVGLVGGLVLLARGFSGYRTATRIEDTATSTISGLAVGEVRVSGLVEPAELTLRSPLQSARCVYYRAKVEQSSNREERTIYHDERSVGFRVRDASGDVRVFPRGARWDVPARFKDHDGIMGDRPPGLNTRTGPAIDSSSLSRDVQAAELLTVHPASSDPDLPGGPSASALAGMSRRSYEEARIEPGDTVTIVGTVLPFDQLPDPASADEDTAIGGAEGSDPEIAADLATARAAGGLAGDAEEAWGNAAIPGFGIGQPVRTPELDPAARAEPLASGSQAETARRMFEIAPDAMVLAVVPGAPMLVSFGAPDVAASRGEWRFTLGLVGAIISIGSAVVLAIAFGGGAR
jgi:hypothetical protein